MARQGAVAGSGRRYSAMSSRMPFILLRRIEMLGHSQAAMARWIVLFWAETPIISEPRQATGRT